MEIQRHLAKLPGWSRSAAGDALTRSYKFISFVNAMKFVNQVASDAEAAKHHPDIEIRYNRVALTLTTVDSGGITMLDVQMAAACDDLADHAR